MITAKTTGRVLNRDRIRHRALRGAAALLAVGFAAGHAVLLIWMQYKGVQQGLVNWPVLLAPAAITLILFPSSWRHWKRWALFYFIVFICNPILLPQVLVITETCVLYSVWVRDRRPGGLDWVRSAGSAIPRRFRRTGSRKPGTAPGQAGKAKNPDPLAKVGPTPKRTKPRPNRAYTKA